MDELDARADLLLAGPRGRAVCLTIAGLRPLDFLTPTGEGAGGRSDDTTIVWLSAEDLHDDERAVVALAGALAAISVNTLALDEPTVTGAVADAVSDAAYWQEPDADELLLADPRIVDSLRPIARAVVGSPAAAWWTAGLDLDDQYFVSWLWRKRQSRADPPLLTGAAERRAGWRQDALREERSATDGRPPEPEAPYSGHWWSTPVFSGLVTTAPRLPDGVPAQLVFVEDPVGMDRARVARLQPRPDIRVWEIDEPADLVDVVSRYPLAVDRARRHDWFRLTGVRGPWLIPDWAAVGVDYDAVHLTTLGYLATAGRALPVEGGFTVLAGWEPGETWWLNDVLEQATEPSTWKQGTSGDWRQRES
ncbi:MAG: hypothetical protein ABWY56_14100 [Propionibacteriaceae bacterium]